MVNTETHPIYVTEFQSIKELFRHSGRKKPKSLQEEKPRLASDFSIVNARRPGSNGHEIWRHRMHDPQTLHQVSLKATGVFRRESLS